METLSKLSTLEKRELHLPSGIVTQAQAGTLLDDELAYYDNITSNQELDILEAMMDYNEVLVSASEEGAVGIHIPLSTLVGRKATGGIVALTPTEANTILAVIQGARAGAVLDLSGGAITSLVAFHTTVACTLLKAVLLYTEASSADAGVVVTIGKESNSAYYYTGDSEASKAEWYEKEVTLLATDIAAGDTVICGTAGGKVGAGNILVIIEYKVD